LIVTGNAIYRRPAAVATGYRHAASALITAARTHDRAIKRTHIPRSRRATSVPTVNDRVASRTTKLTMDAQAPVPYSFDLSCIRL